MEKAETPAKNYFRDMLKALYGIRGPGAAVKEMIEGTAKAIRELDQRLCSLEARLPSVETEDVWKVPEDAEGLLIVRRHEPNGAEGDAALDLAKTSHLRLHPMSSGAVYTMVVMRKGFLQPSLDGRGSTNTWYCTEGLEDLIVKIAQKLKRGQSAGDEENH